MKLSNATRDYIVREAVDFFMPTIPDIEDLEAVQKEVQGLLIAGTPPEVMICVRKYPMYFQMEDDVRMKRKSFTGSWWNDGAFKMRLVGGMPIAGFASFHELENSEFIERLLVEHEKYVAERADLRTKIKAVVYACNTTGQLSEQMPELVQFFPPDNQAGLPVPIEQFARLRNELHALAQKNK
jgi:hypothetical protein